MRQFLRDTFILGSVRAGIVGTIAGLIFLLAAFATGSAFGQRCSAAGLHRGTAPWDQCVRDLVAGKPTSAAQRPLAQAQS